MTRAGEPDSMFLTYTQGRELSVHLARVCRICGAQVSIPELHRTYHNAEKR